MTARIGPGSRREIGLLATLLGRLAGRAMGTTPPAVFTILARTRRVFWGWMAFASALMPFGHLSRRESEMVILSVAALSDSAYEAAHHRKLGRRAGLSAAEIESILGGPPVSFSPREQAILDAVRNLHETGDLDDTQWAALRAQLDEQDIVELLLLIGNYQSLAMTLNVLRVPIDPPR